MCKQNNTFFNDVVLSLIEKSLRQCCSNDYAGIIAYSILDDVVEDLECCTDEGSGVSVDDLKLAIGRVLIKRLQIEY